MLLFSTELYFAAFNKDAPMNIWPEDVDDNDKLDTEEGELEEECGADNEVRYSLFIVCCVWYECDIQSAPNSLQFHVHHIPRATSRLVIR